MKLSFTVFLVILIFFGIPLTVVSILHADDVEPTPEEALFYISTVQGKYPYVVSYTTDNCGLTITNELIPAYSTKVPFWLNGYKLCTTPITISGDYTITQRGLCK